MTVNGEKFDRAALEPEFDVQSLLRHLALSGKRVAIELNGELLSQSQYAGQRLSENDQVEIIHYVGGG
ncbi:MAG: sulfur carrier protein ThiS [Spirochaetota bacterium]